MASTDTDTVEDDDNAIQEWRQRELPLATGDFKWALEISHDQGHSRSDPSLAFLTPVVMR